METTDYKYSIWQGWFIAILMAGILSWLVFILFRFGSDYRILLGMIPLFLIVVGMAIYFCKKFFLPLLKGEISLELDKEKLQFFITQRVIYWKDIKDISYIRYGIIFKMKDLSKDIDISTKYVAVSTDTIYNTIVEYFEKYR